MSFFQLHAHKSFSHMNIIQANQDYCVLLSFILKYSAFYLKLVKQKFSEAEIDHLDQTDRQMEQSNPVFNTKNSKFLKCNLPKVKYLLRSFTIPPIHSSYYTFLHDKNTLKWVTYFR